VGPKDPKQETTKGKKANPVGAKNSACLRFLICSCWTSPRFSILFLLRLRAGRQGSKNPAS
jgi:hypothetical protein